MKKDNSSPFKIRKTRRVTPKLKPKEVERLAAEAHAAIVTIEQVKPLYDRLDAITLMLLGQDLSRYGLTMVDNFAVENKKFKGTYVSRFELKRSG